MPLIAQATASTNRTETMFHYFHYKPFGLGVLMTIAALVSQASDLEIIDTHFHSQACEPGGLEQAREWMDLHGVSRTLHYPIKESRPKNAEERARMLENFARYRGKIERATVIYPDEVSSVEEAVAILKQEQADGAVAFGEHYGYQRMFDDPASMRLYAACAQVGLPLMFHMDGRNNKDTEDFKHLENALKAHPDCVFIAHAPGWWRRLGTGHCSRLLETYPNLYADISAGSGYRNLSRDIAYTTEFMKQHHRKLLFATDCGWWSFEEIGKPAPQFALMRELELSEDIKADIYHRNAKRVFGFKSNEMEKTRSNDE